MANPKFNSIYYQAPGVYKSVNETLGTNVAGDLWDPTTGTSFRLMGGLLQTWVSVLLNGDEVAGSTLILYDNVVTVPIVNLHVFTEPNLVAGSILGTGSTDASALAAGVTAHNTANRLDPFRFDLPGGYKATAANNILRVGMMGIDGAIDTIGTSGVIKIQGVLWGHEE